MRSRPKYDRMEEQAVQMSQRSSVVIAKVRLKKEKISFFCSALRCSRQN